MEKMYRPPQPKQKMYFLPKSTIAARKSKKNAAFLPTPLSNSVIPYLHHGSKQLRNKKQQQPMHIYLLVLCISTLCWLKIDRIGLVVIDVEVEVFALHICILFCVWLSLHHSEDMMGRGRGRGGGSVSSSWVLGWR